MLGDKRMDRTDGRHDIGWDSVVDSDVEILMARVRVKTISSAPCSLCQHEER